MTAGFASFKHFATGMFLKVGGLFPDVPSDIGTTRAMATASPLVVISDGVKTWVTLGCSKGSFSHTVVAPALRLGTTHH